MEEERKRTIAGSVLGLIVVACAIWQLLPIVFFIPVSFTGIQSFMFPPPSWSTRWWEALLSNPAWVSAFVNSLVVGVCVAVISTTLGTLTAFGIVRSRSPLAGVIRLVVLSPMILPSMIIAIGLYGMFLRAGLVGSYLGFILAYAGGGAPFVVIIVSASLQTMDRNLERAAMSLGAGPLATFFQITLPFIRPGLLAGAFFGFLGAFDEVITGLYLSTSRLTTLPVLIWQNTTDQQDPTVAVIASIYLVLVATALITFMAVQIRRARQGSSRGAAVMGIRL
jgi:putative spermidine/putrescine transport system permease protein